MKAEIIGFLSGRALATISGGAEEMKTIDPTARDRKLDQPDLAELAAGLAEDGFEHLLQAPVDAANERRAIKHRFAKPDQRTANEIGGQEPEQSEPDNGDEDAKPWNMERQVAVRRHDVRQPGPHPVVDRIDDPPGDIGGDRDRTEHNEPGEKPGSEPLAEGTVEGRERIGHGDLSALRPDRMTTRRCGCKTNAKRLAFEGLDKRQ